MPFIQFSQALERTSMQREWLVESLIEKDTMALMTGAPAAGKSFLTVDLACALATGTSWLHYPIPHAVPVYYLSSENPNSVIRRMEAWRVHHGLASMPDTLLVTPYATTLTRNMAEELAEEMSHGPGLLIVDTWSRALPGVNENSAQEVSEVIHGFDYLRLATGSAVLLVHHISKGTSESRGSGALPAAMDTIFHITDTGATRTVDVVKNKDGGTGTVQHFRIVDTPLHVGVVEVAQ